MNYGKVSTAIIIGRRAHIIDSFLLLLVHWLTMVPAAI